MEELPWFSFGKMSTEAKHVKWSSNTKKEWYTKEEIVLTTRATDGNIRVGE